MIWFFLSVGLIVWLTFFPSTLPIVKLFGGIDVRLTIFVFCCTGIVFSILAFRQIASKPIAFAALAFLIYFVWFSVNSGAIGWVGQILGLWRDFNNQVTPKI